MSHPNEQIDIRRLINAGVSEDDAVELAIDAAEVFELNRKTRGARSGALGIVGCDMYRKLASPDYEPDVQAFLEYRPYTAENIAAQMVRSVSAVSSAVNKLIQHRFIDRRRNGRSFSVRLLIPALALTEYGEHYLDRYEPGMAGFEDHQPLAGKMLVLFPRQS